MSPLFPPFPVNFYAGGLDRASHLRKDEAWLAARRHDRSSRLVPVWRGENLIALPTPEAPRAVLLAVEAVAGTEAENTHLLGLAEDCAYFALDLSSHDSPQATLDIDAGAEFMDLRRVGPLLPRREGSLLAYARGLVYWHARHGYCGVCGSPTRSEEAGHLRRCTDPQCATPHFPRTDPGVIMLVHDGERCLLGRQKSWAPGMRSTLAGFVEPGESLEEAVAREVYEETKVTLDRITYHSSQPWPFPASLMLGFHASARSTAIEVDHSELEDAAWYQKDWLRTHQDDESFRLPRRDSIARRLIEDWLAR
jgi:NAD+ diphosphatase